MKEWMKELTIDELDEKNREIAEVIGIENLLLMMKAFGGDRIYFNRLPEIYKELRDNRINKEYTGYNLREIARKYEVSTERIKQIIKEGGN